MNFISDDMMIGKKTYDDDERSTPATSSQTPFSLASVFFSVPVERDICLSCSNGVFSWAIIERNNTTDYAIAGWGSDTDISIFYEDIKRLGPIKPDRNYFSSSISGTQTLFKKISIPVTLNSKDRSLALVDAIERMSPQPISFSSADPHGLAIAFWTRGENDEELTYDTYVASIHHIDRQVSFINSYLADHSFSIENIFPKVAGLHIWAQQALEESDHVLVVDIGVDETVAFLYSNKEIILIRCIPVGLQAFTALDIATEAIQDIPHTLRQLMQNLIEVRQTCRIHLDSIADELCLCLTGSIVLSKLYSQVVIEFLELSQANYSSAWEKKVESLSFSHIDIRAVAAECGIAYLGNETVTFSRKNERFPLFQYESKNQSKSVFQRHSKRSFICLLFASLFVCCTLVVWGCIQENQISAVIDTEWYQFKKELLTKPLFDNERREIDDEQKEKSTKSKNHDKEYEAKTREDILLALSQQLQKKTSFSLMPQIPSFTQTLLAIDSLVYSINEAAAATSQIDENGLLLQSFKYTMTKRPDIKRPLEKYQARVDIEFTSPSQALARKMYDALLQSKTLVDKESDVKWSVTNGKYKASFFVRNTSSTNMIFLRST